MVSRDGYGAYSDDVVYSTGGAVIAEPTIAVVPSASVYYGTGGSFGINYEFPGRRFYRHYYDDSPFYAQRRLLNRHYYLRRMMERERYYERRHHRRHRYDD